LHQLSRVNLAVLPDHVDQGATVDAEDERHPPPPGSSDTDNVATSGAMKEAPMPFAAFEVSAATFPTTDH
jgi:hypothetical protein